MLCNSIHFALPLWWLSEPRRSVDRQSGHWTISSDCFFSLGLLSAKYCFALALSRSRFLMYHCFCDSFLRAIWAFDSWSIVWTWHKIFWQRQTSGLFCSNQSTPQWIFFFHQSLEYLHQNPLLSVRFWFVGVCTDRCSMIHTRARIVWENSISGQCSCRQFFQQRATCILCNLLLAFCLFILGVLFMPDSMLCVHSPSMHVWFDWNCGICW